MDINAVSAAIGHTNVMSTRNAFLRLKKKWDLGNIPVTSGKVPGQDDGMLFFLLYYCGFLTRLDDVLKPKISSESKVGKKRGPPKGKAKKGSGVLRMEDSTEDAQFESSQPRGSQLEGDAEEDA